MFWQPPQASKFSKYFKHASKSPKPVTPQNSKTYTPLCAPCDCIMAIIDHSNTAVPLLLLFHPFELPSLTTATIVKKCQVLIQHPWTNSMWVMFLQVNILCQWMCLSVHVLFAHFIYWCINLFWVHGDLGHFVLFTFILFACLLTVLTLSMLWGSMIWGK